MRERDVRNALKAALESTNAFDLVALSGLSESWGFGASDRAAAVIEPNATRFMAGWDSVPAGMVDLTAMLKVTLLARDPDPQLRDELAEQLLDVLANQVNGQNLVPGFTIPQKTVVIDWTWVDATAPERRIRATVSYAYLLASWGSFDTSQ